MLFEKKLTEVSNQIDSNTSEINQLLVTVENLQEDNKKYQEYLQKLGAASKASESALEQLKNAFLMLKTIDYSLLETLKKEVDELYLQVQNNEIKSSKKLNSTSVYKLNNKLTENNEEKETRTRKSRTNSKSSNHRKSANPDESEAKIVNVEVLEPEENHPNKSHYEAVMKIKQLL